jgi:ParB/Sulfiredoxin domain
MSTIELKPIKLGKNVELRHIPFSELAVPWNISVNSSAPSYDNHHSQQIGATTFTGKRTKGPKAAVTLKREDLEELTQSLAQYGLLKPFEVAEMPQRLGFFYGGRGQYLILDGQRRYFAIRELLKLPTEQDEKGQKDHLRTNCRQIQVQNAETQAQEQFDKLSIMNYVLVPCLVYPYTTMLQMMRHSTEEKRLSRGKPAKHDNESANKMRMEGLEDISPEDLTGLMEIRSQIEEEKEAIKRTLNEIRKRTR